MVEKESGPQKLNLQSTIDRLRDWSVETSPQLPEKPLSPDQLLEQHIRNTLVLVRTSLQLGDEVDATQWTEFKTLLHQRVAEVEAQVEARRAQSQDTLDSLHTESTDRLRAYVDSVIELGDKAVS